MKKLGISNWMGNGMRQFWKDKGFEFVDLNKHIPWKQPDRTPHYDRFVRDACKCEILSIAKGFHYKKHKLTADMIRDIKKAGTYIIYHQLDVPSTYKKATTWEGLLEYYREFWVEANIIFLPFMEAINLARKHGLPAHIIHPGYDNETFDRDLNNQIYSNTTDVSIVGKCYGNRSPFPRAEIARKLIEAGIDIRLYGWHWLERQEQREEADHLVQGDPTLKPYYYGELAGRTSGPGTVTEGFNRGRLTLSSHLHRLTEYSNGRLYETCGLAKCTLCDHNPGLEELGFIDGQTIVFYDSYEELIDKAKYYLAHERKREKIGRRARKLVLERHTQWKRGEELWCHYRGIK